MKKTAVYILAATLLCGLCTNVNRTHAQSATGASKDIFTSLPREVYDSINEARRAEAKKQRAYEDSVLDAYYRTPYFFPNSVLAALGEQRSKDAEREYKKFKDTVNLNGIDPFYPDFLDFDFMARMADYGASDHKVHIKYLKMQVKKRDQLRKKYPSRPEVIELDLWQQDAPSPEKLIDVFTRMIRADSSYLPAFEQRAAVLWGLGFKEEACMDISRLPKLIQDQLREMEECNKLAENKMIVEDKQAVELKDGQKETLDEEAEEDSEQKKTAEQNTQPDPNVDTDPWMTVDEDWENKQ